MRNQNSKKFITSKEGETKDGEKQRKGSILSRSRILGTQPATPLDDSKSLRKSRFKEVDESMFERDELQV